MDDHVTVRAGTRMLLEAEGLAVVAECATLAQTREALAEHGPDLLVLDLCLGTESALTAIPELTGLFPATAVLVQSAQEDVAVVRQALDAGARGYLSKNGSVAELVAAARAVVAGGYYVASSLARRMLASSGAPGLTAREAQILRLLALGHTNKETADQLGLSVRTVESERAALRSRLDLVSRADLVAFARRTGLACG
ncbi:response regulator [Kitasatospora sp. NPDC094011]|uniref:response regulator n=1 Tax=Kitasatospora sp. NPDC094011 TaxID=3364090 RepID=UPI00380AADE6